ncbi:MAG: VOC family protein [Rhodospirillaceae bacterium]|nr:VOC family protein [Rhodospirillaceae bacterium]MBT6205850.1 VOC family protein [Rhodospirillaceae bacterium]MBT7646844.1 VOC family protein [Rhodospirillaceae bacterium]
MIRIREIDHVVLRVADIERSRAFWRDVLGCPVERERPDLGLYQMRAGACLIDLVPVDSQLGRMGGAGPDREGHNMDHVCLRVEPFDEAGIRAHLAHHGIETSASGQRYGAEGNGPSLYLQDPDGNTVELKGPPEA